MTAKNRVRKIMIELPEPSRKVLFGWMVAGFVTIAGMQQNFHCKSEAKQDTVIIKADSIGKSRFVVRADLDTLKREMRVLAQQFKTYEVTATVLIAEFKNNHTIDSANINSLIVAVDKINKTDLAQNAQIDILQRKFYKQ